MDVEMILPIEIIFKHNYYVNSEYWNKTNSKTFTVWIYTL